MNVRKTVDKKTLRQYSLKFIIITSPYFIFLWRTLIRSASLAMASLGRFFRPAAMLIGFDPAWVSSQAFRESLQRGAIHICKSQSDISGPNFSDWWFGTFFIFPYIGNNLPNWLIFFRGVETTNHLSICGRLVGLGPRCVMLCLITPCTDLGRLEIGRHNRRERPIPWAGRWCPSQDQVG